MKYQLGEIIDTEEIGTSKVVGIYVKGMGSRQDLIEFVYALEDETESIYFMGEGEITIRGL